MNCCSIKKIIQQSIWGNMVLVALIGSQNTGKQQYHVKVCVEHQIYNFSMQKYENTAGLGLTRAIRITTNFVSWRELSSPTDCNLQSSLHNICYESLALRIQIVWSCGTMLCYQFLSFFQEISRQAQITQCHTGADSKFQLKLPVLLLRDYVCQKKHQELILSAHIAREIPCKLMHLQARLYYMREYRVVIDFKMQM